MNDTQLDPVTRKLLVALEELVTQRNKAEHSVNSLIGDLHDVAFALLCEPSQKGVLGAIEVLKAARAAAEERASAAEDRVRLLETLASSPA